MYRPYLAVGVTILLLRSVALPQSLGDLARKTEEERQKSKPASKVYTNEDLKRDPGGLTPAPGPSSPAAAPAEAKPGVSTPTPADAPKADAKASATPQEPPRDEKYWRDRIAEARTQLGRTKLLLEALQTRLNSLTTDIVNRDDPAQRAVLERDRQDTVLELGRLKKELQDQAKAISDIEEEARRASVPPGWLR